MMLKNIGLLAVDSNRTRAYLSALKNHQMKLGHVIFLNEHQGPSSDFHKVPFFDNLTPALETIRLENLRCDLIATGDVNSSEVLAAVKKSPVGVFIYSGPGGAILGREILSLDKRFLHVHPGLLPQFRGSTTVYYSLLLSGQCGASAIFLDESIDTGPVLAMKTYPPPEDRTLLDHGYDPYIRSDLLIEVLKRYGATGQFDPLPQGCNGGKTYSVMHPVLRHITILSQR